MKEKNDDPYFTSRSHSLGSDGNAGLGRPGERRRERRQRRFGQGVVQGVGQAGKGLVKGTGTVLKKTGKGVVCLVTLGNRC